MPKDDLKKEPAEIKTETKTVEVIKEELRSDAFTAEERKSIIKIIQDDVDFAEDIQEDYVKQKELDLKHYHMAKPSELEGLQKEAWMSDRNLGLARAVADSYQAVLLATCWNPDSINFIPTRTSELDNRNNQAAFTKWGMGKQECNAHPEMDGFVHNRIVVGSSYFKIYRKTWEEWVDKRIPVKNKKGNTYKWEIKTDKVKMVKGVIENIPDIDDILIPEYGKNIQELPFFIEILHLDGENVLDYIDRKVFKPANKEDYKKKLHNHAFKTKERKLAAEKAENQGISADTMTDLDVRRLSIDLYEWYGMYTKDGKTEKYRFIADLVNDELLSGKPLRKINRSGKIPFAGSALHKEPGQIRGNSLMEVVAPIINAFNNVFNQKSDFQYVENCPTGFHVPDEGYTKGSYKLIPGVSYPVSGPKASDSVYWPNRQRSMAWAESDIRILFEVLERLTGAASYFAVGQQRNKTLGQDMLVDKQSETRFGLWVSRIIEDICEAIGMWFELYQDYPPKNLAERILGEDGKQLFKNLSIDTLRGDTNVMMTPDTVAGSKAYHKQVRMMLFNLAQQMIWLNPQINPSGNYELCSDTIKELIEFTDSDVRRYLGEKPKQKFNVDELDNEWTRFMNGEEFDPPEGETPLSMQHLEGHEKQRLEKYDQLDEEYRPNFDAHLFKTKINVVKFKQNAHREQIANQIAQRMIMENPQGAGGGVPSGVQGGGAPVQPMNAPVGQPPIAGQELPGGANDPQ